MNDDQQQRLDAASALERVGLWEEASRSLDAVYRSALEQQDFPTSMEALARLAYCHSRAGEFATVDPTLEELIGREPKQMREVMRGELR